MKRLVIPPRLFQAAELFIQVLIVYSIFTFVLETMPELSRFARFFEVSEAVVVAIFTVEYAIRWATAEKKWTYPFRPMSLVDLAAILPFFLALQVDLRAVRAFRLVRVLRILKLARYNQALQHLADAFALVRREFAVFAFLAGITLLLSATGIYYAEHDSQPDKFGSILACLWWSIVTLTTVGYGDVFPVTPFGKVFASLVMVVGIGVVAIPTGLMSSALTELARNKRDRRVACSPLWVSMLSLIP